MTLKGAFIPVAALAVVLNAGVFAAEAGQDRDRQGEQGRSGQARTRRDAGRRGSEARAPRSDGRDGREQRGQAQAQARRDDGPDRRGEVRGPRDNGRAWRGDDRGRQRDNRVWRSDRRNDRFYGSPRYVSPRIIVPRRSPYRHYGPGPGLSVYFGTGSGYRYGSPYYGRVYGYSMPSRGYGVRRDYGDVRLDIRPREAAVYVDGYYAGIVDNFDGVFQRLTLEAGPHRIEIELPGFETRGFDVMVDPTRTVDVRDELFAEQP